MVVVVVVVVVGRALLLLRLLLLLRQGRTRWGLKSEIRTKSRMPVTCMNFRVRISEEVTFSRQYCVGMEP